MITIRFGVNSINAENVSGMTISEIRQSYADALAIPSGASAMVNSNPVDDTYRVQNNQNVEFHKTMGEKGVSVVAPRSALSCLGL